MIDTKKAREEMAAIYAEAKAFEEKYADAKPTDEEQAAQDARYAKMDEIKAKIDRADKLAKYSFETKAANVVAPAKSEAQVAYERHEAKAAVTSADKIDRAEFGKALAGWALTGEMPQQFATITTATGSGAYLPKQVAQPVVPLAGNAIRRGMALVGATAVTTDGTAEMNVPLFLAAKGTDLSESATSGVENGTDGSAALSNINLKCSVTQSGQVPVSNLELAALDYDLLGAIVPGLEDSKEMRLEEKAMAAIVADSGITQKVTLGGLTSDDLDFDALNDANQGFTSSRFDRLKVLYLSPAGYAAASKMKGSDGHPILTPDPQNQSLLRYQGTPVVKSDYLEAFGASKVVGVVISFVGFKLRDAGQSKLIRITDDKDYVDQTILNLVSYNAYGYVKPAIVKIVCSAS